MVSSRLRYLTLEERIYKALQTTVWDEEMRAKLYSVCILAHLQNRF